MSGRSESCVLPTDRSANTPHTQTRRGSGLSDCVAVLNSAGIMYQYLRPFGGVCLPAATDNKSGQPVDCSNTQTPQQETESVCLRYYR